MKKDQFSKYITIISRNMNYCFNKKLEEYSINKSHLQILHYLHNHEGVIQSELGHSLMLDKITVTKVLKKLVEEGYVEKKEGKEDKRQKKLYITEKGHRFHDEVFSITLEINDILSKGFSPGEKQMTMELLIRMSENIYDVVQNLR
ncbi:MarR family transcriptional regulator [Wukongibacter baidiensis]|uniref:MarR family winged helix-turn-helix transcriptional regulator n=1 Tax=Wukongibacter baidiensis TaxID=1723361 RepID=UPI003D7FA1F5